MNKDVKILLLLTGGVALFVYLNKKGFFKQAQVPTPVPEPQTGIGHSTPCNQDEEDVATPEGTKCVPKTTFSGNKQFIVNQTFTIDVSNPNYQGSRSVTFNEGDIFGGGYMTYYKYNYDNGQFVQVTDLITTPNGQLPNVFDSGNQGLAIGEVIINIPQGMVSEVGGIRPAFKETTSTGAYE